MFTIYHNPRCKKSRAGLQYLQSRGIEPDIVEYLKEPFSEPELKDLLAKLGKKPAEMIRTREEEYKTDLKGKKLSEDEWIKVMVDNPKLIHRPIVVKGTKAVLGDPAQNIDSLL